MAILQSSLTEEHLSRQEKAVLRGIYRAAQLNEGLIQLSKIVISIKDVSMSQRGPLPESYTDHIENMAKYLTSKISAALVSTKVPVLPDDKRSTSNDV